MPTLGTIGTKSLEEMKTYRLMLTIFAWLAFVVLSPAQILRQPQPFEYTPQLESKARSGDAESQFRIGYSYFHGKQGGPLCQNIGVERNFRLAYEYFKKAFEQGHAEASYWVGVFYDQDLMALSGIKQDQAKARSIFEKAMNLGSANACAALANYYKHGYGGAKDISKAIQLYEKTAALGMLVSMNNLATILIANKDFYNPKRAIELFQKAADGGYVLAYYNLGFSWLGKQSRLTPQELHLGWDLYFLAEISYINTKIVLVTPFCRTSSLRRCCHTVCVCPQEVRSV